MLTDLFLLLLILCPFEGSNMNITDSMFPNSDKFLHDNLPTSSNWSFMAVIVYGKRVLCAGTAFNIKWIITMAHCVHGNLRKDNLERFGSMGVRLGAAPISYKKVKEVEKKKYEEDEDDELYVPVVDFDELLPVYSVVVHPKYIYKENFLINTTLAFVGVNDLALVKFKKSPTLFVPTLLLSPDYSGWCVAAGWDLSMSKEPLVAKIHEFSLYVGNKEQCQPYLDESADKIPYDMKESYKENKICSLHSGDIYFHEIEDADGGGPLICKNRLQGIISHYYKKNQNFYNFFYDLTQFVTWIRKEIFEGRELEINGMGNGRSIISTTTTTSSTTIYKTTTTPSTTTETTTTTTTKTIISTLGTAPSLRLGTMGLDWILGFPPNTTTATPTTTTTVNTTTTLTTTTTPTTTTTLTITTTPTTTTTLKIPTTLTTANLTTTTTLKTPTTLTTTNLTTTTTLKTPTTLTTTTTLKTPTTLTRTNLTTATTLKTPTTLTTSNLTTNTALTTTTTLKTPTTLTTINLTTNTTLKTPTTITTIKNLTTVKGAITRGIREGTRSDRPYELYLNVTLPLWASKFFKINITRPTIPETTNKTLITKDYREKIRIVPVNALVPNTTTTIPDTSTYVTTSSDSKCGFNFLKINISRPTMTRTIKKTPITKGCQQRESRDWLSGKISTTTTSTSTTTTSTTRKAAHPTRRTIRTEETTSSLTTTTSPMSRTTRYKNDEEQVGQPTTTTTEYEEIVITRPDIVTDWPPIIHVPPRRTDSEARGPWATNMALAVLGFICLGLVLLCLACVVIYFININK